MGETAWSINAGCSLLRAKNSTGQQMMSEKLLSHEDTMATKEVVQQSEYHVI